MGLFDYTWLTKVNIAVLETMSDDECPWKLSFSMLTL